MLKKITRQHRTSFLLAAVAFITGFVLMQYELVAARLLAPTIGSSSYVWTSVIGMIIAALSLGYWLGGKLADLRHQVQDVAYLCLLTALTIGLTLIWQEGVLVWLADTGMEVRLQAVVAATVLFVPTSIVLGTISPYLVKLHIHSLEQTGRGVARLSALNSIGSIVGTFMTGFFLFGVIGSRETLVVSCLLMILTSWLIAPRVYWQLRAGMSVAVLVLAVTFGSSYGRAGIDTASAHYQIVEWQQDQGTVRGLRTGPGGIQSAVDIDEPERLVFWYTQQIANIISQRPEAKRILVLGGGTYTLAQHLAKKYPNKQIDVVEIDPELVQIAREHFFYTDPSNVRTIVADARSYVAQSNEHYDAVVVDVYSDSAVPFSFTTDEFGKQLAARLSANGVVMVNMIAGDTSECRPLAAALAAPYQKYLDEGRYLLQRRNQPSNLIAVYGSAELNDTYTSPFFLQQAPFTDNFAPIEQRHGACLNKG